MALTTRIAAPGDEYVEDGAPLLLLRIRSVHLVSDFSAKQRFDSAYKHSRSTLDKFKEFVFQSVQEILGFAFVLPEKRLNRDTKLIFDFEAAILHYIDGVVRKYIAGLHVTS